MYINDSSSRNSKHVILALQQYRYQLRNDSATTGIELDQFDATINAFIQACSSALYDEEQAEKKRKKGFEAVKAEIKAEDEIPF